MRVISFVRWECWMATDGEKTHLQTRNHNQWNAFVRSPRNGNAAADIHRDSVILLLLLALWLCVCVCSGSFVWIFWNLFMSPLKSFPIRRAPFSLLELRMRLPYTLSLLAVQSARLIHGAYFLCKQWTEWGYRETARPKITRVRRIFCQS